MRILVLGGTSFVGRAIVEQALAAGDELTLFGRGRTGPKLFPGVRRLTGDRSTGDYAALARGSWDAVVDVSGYLPRHIAQAADALGDRVGRYLFISTGSVYDHTRAADQMAEDSPRLAPVRDTEQITLETYGPLKVACEDEVLARFGGRGTLVRPGIVAGPYDPTDRFTYWVRRAARGGRVALPGKPDQPVQVVDAGDLARLVSALNAADRSGTYNAVGPAERVTLAELVQTCARATGSTVTVVPIDPAGVEPGFPLILASDGSWDAMFRRSAAAGRAVGLTATPLAETAAAVRRWDLDRGEPPLTVGLTAEGEAELLATA